MRTDWMTSSAFWTVSTSVKPLRERCCCGSSSPFFLNIVPKLLGISREIGGVNFSPDAVVQMDVSSDQPKRLDLEIFINEKLSKLEKNIPDFDVVKEEVRQTLVKRAEGTFLWIDLLIRHLEQSDLETAEEVRGFVANIPSGIHSLYSWLLDDTGLKPELSSAMPFDGFSWPDHSCQYASYLKR
jgi:hypothetical protein